MLLHTDQLTKKYGNFRALDRLTLEIREGEVFGLLGPNGSGKSTTLRLFLGMIQPTSGKAAIAGFDCWAQSMEVRRRVTYLPGELRLYDNMTGRQFLQFLAGLRGQRVDGAADKMARQFDIDLRRPIRNLSSGMKRKLALLAVLLPRVPLVILDEPTNTLDPTMRDEFLAQVAAARQEGQSVLFSSHVLQEVERVCNRVGILALGKLVHLQAMQELRRGRIAHVRLSGPATSPPPGEVTVAKQQDGEWLLHSQGDPQPLLAWLAQQPVEDVRLEPQGLNAVYQRYHAGNGE
jgi:ABC-2 type transport system ATP-binding protein